MTMITPSLHACRPRDLEKQIELLKLRAQFKNNEKKD